MWKKENRKKHKKTKKKLKKEKKKKKRLYWKILKKIQNVDNCYTTVINYI